MPTQHQVKQMAKLIKHQDQVFLRLGVTRNENDLWNKLRSFGYTYDNITELYRLTDASDP